MSSGTEFNSKKAIAAANATPIGGSRITPRQRRLNALYAMFRCEQYAHLSHNWEGEAIPDEFNSMLSREQPIPPGFVSAGPSPDGEIPLSGRRPTAPYNLARVIVERFTGLLFSEKRHPQIRVVGDEKQEKFLRAICHHGRLWARMPELRNFGGAMGSSAIGFFLVRGKPVFEVFDPRFAFPEFTNRREFTVHKLEIRYQYNDLMLDPEEGWVERPFWYRRVIDAQTDRTWERVPVNEREPAWGKKEPTFENEHRLGFCPIVWIQNIPVQDQVDGDPDCLGTFEMMRALDALLSQANRGIISNCDPTLVFSTALELRTIRKGSDNAIKLGPGESATYLEINGAGPKAAVELAEKIEKMITRVARVVIDQSQSDVMRTATEINRDYSAMMEKADVLREQYGERGLKRLMEVVLETCRKMTTPYVDQKTGRTVTPKLMLPPAPIVDPETGKTSFEEYEMGESDAVDLLWGPYFPPTIQDISTAVTAASTAVDKFLLSRKRAIEYISPYFNIPDAAAEELKILADQQSDMERAQEMMRQQQAMEEGGAPEEEGEDLSDEEIDGMMNEQGGELEDEEGAELPEESVDEAAE